MNNSERTYRLTLTGRAFLVKKELPLPAGYRRMLGIIGTEAHFDVIRGALRRFPDKLIEDWLSELKELGYLEVIPGAADLDLDFSHFFDKRVDTPSASPEDADLHLREANTANAALANTGAWISEERLKNHSANPKPHADTVVLIVEDDEDQRALAKLRLTMAGYKVRFADNAKQLLEDIRTQAPPDILLLDVMLPDGDGFDILGKLRKHPKFALMLVALLTAKTSTAEIAHGLALGADAYITKPYSKTMLADTIDRILVGAKRVPQKLAG